MNDKKQIIEDWVDQAYEKLQKSIPGFCPRPQQVLFSKSVAWVLSSPSIMRTSLVAEAPTGVGKSIGYLIGILAARGVYPAVSVQVVTATKLLQEQLVDSDVQKLRLAGLLPPNGSVVLAKGASNYLCMRRLESLIPLRKEADIDPSAPLSAGEFALSTKHLEYLKEQYQSGSWDGDFDHLKIDSVVKHGPVGADTKLCSGKECKFYNTCALMRAKKNTELATIVVSNQDLLLSQASLYFAEGSTPGFRLVIDEAHNLPEKSLSRAHAVVKLPELKEAFVVVSRVVSAAQKKSPMKASAFLVPELGLLREAFDRIDGVLQGMDFDEDEGHLRFPGASVPKDVSEACVLIRRQLGFQANTLGPALREDGPVKDVFGKAAWHSLESAYSTIAGAMDLIEAYSEPRKNIVYWARRFGEGFELNSVPLDSSEVLSKLLWSSPDGYSAVLVSATLKTPQGYEPFVKKLGLPLPPAVRTLDHVFDYPSNELILVPMRHTPKMHERQQFIEEFSKKVLLELKKSPSGSLVLVPSWSFLEKVVPLLREGLPEGMLKVQGEHPLKSLLASHLADVDDGRPSALLGTQSLAEGLNLPGKYCEHVHIATIPFPVPTGPYDKELAELLGKEYFHKHSLPSASIRLKQMVGRLLRCESDSGKVSLYDPRLRSERYGKLLVKELPPFKVVAPA